MLRRLMMAVWTLALALSAPEVRAQDHWAPPDTVITMIRGACEHRCPVYRVVIFAGGTVLVQGQHYLRRPLLAKSEIPAADVLKLVERFKAVDYFKLDDMFGLEGKGCTSMSTHDGPNVTTTLVTGGRGKSVIHRHGCQGGIPEQLTALEDAIDETANTGRWLKDAAHR